jgi:hypothetical protein
LPKGQAEALRGEASEDVRLMLAGLGSARPRLPKVVAKIFDFTFALQVYRLSSQIIVVVTQQVCLHPDHLTSVAEAAPIIPSAQSE